MLLELAPLSAGEKLLFILISLVGVLVSLGFVFSRLSRYRLIVDTPTAKVRSAPQGYVELIGHAMPGEDGALDAPLSGRPCVWYEYKVEELKEDNGRKRWRPVRSGRSSHLFRLDDGTGSCLIDPRGAEVTPRHKHSWRGQSTLPGTRNLTPDAVVALFSTHIGNGQYRFTERLIFEHEPLYALGDFHSRGGGRDHLNMRETVRDLLRNWKRNPEQLLTRFDANGDGKINPDEWQQARQAAEQEARQQQQSLHQQPSVHVLRAPQTSSRPFLLSTHDEERLVRRYRWLVAGCLTGVLFFFWFFLEVLLAN
ncbi:GIDE domain-containing protein [Marinobacterium marinum]|uniref:RING-type E3 ubiquitin transferase n=1 Tax=Marinobacterium marinum TaxID=2756129 RepID=A0A7W2ABT0_9GAMM|nr:GIDE domain-containing protein [Marinobacterium marinum]MBA4502380.1 hypothetical protein [Marinobacterium marinum]